jgi:hypothetical protein
MEELNLEGDLSYNKILIKILETVEGERERELKQGHQDVKNSVESTYIR